MSENLGTLRYIFFFAEKQYISKKKWSRSEVEYLQSGREIYEALTASRQPDMIEGLLTDRQIGKLMDYKRQLYDEKQQELNSRFQAAWQGNGDVSTLEPCQEKACLSRKTKRHI